MTRRNRTRFFYLAACLLALVFFSGYRQLPPAGQGQSPYGDAVNSLTVPQRHITDAVTAVNFDVRGFDTLGEEFILFAAVMGVVLLMRRQKDEPTGDHEDKARHRRVPHVSDAIRVTSLLLVAPTVLFGFYIVAHGTVSPGGGFQGGVILSTAPLLIYLASGYRKFSQVVDLRLVAISEAIGAAVYILIGGACVLLGGLFLQNLLPSGENGTIISGGTVSFINLGVGAEVSGGIVLTLLIYLEELMEEKEQ
jgi:multicomponent Na+:H+ antiporter subunit B